LAAAVSSGGGCGLSFPEAPEDDRDFEGETGSAEFKIEEWAESLSMDDAALDVSGGAEGRGLKRACSGSFGSTMSLEELELPKRLIFFARATMEERRRSRMDGCAGAVGAGPGAGLLALALAVLLVPFVAGCSDDARIAASIQNRDILRPIQSRKEGYVTSFRTERERQMKGRERDRSRLIQCRKGVCRELSCDVSRLPLLR
jgi:hypothetical protein